MADKETCKMKKLKFHSPPEEVNLIIEDIGDIYGMNSFEKQAQEIFTEDTFKDSIATTRFRVLNN